MRFDHRLCLLLSMLAVGCQSPGAPDPTGGARNLEHDFLLPAGDVGERTEALTTGDGPNGEQVLYVNFDGATLTRTSNGGSNSDNAAQNKSWVPNVIAVGASVAYPAFDTSPYAPTYDAATVKNKIVQQVTAWYAPYNVQVTATRPSSGRYTMMMVGGHAGSFISPAGGAVGVAPLDCGNSSQVNIGYAFALDLTPFSTSTSAKLQSITMVAQTVAHEAGHTFGLEHVDSTGTVHDIMEPSVNPAVTGFLSGGQALSDGSASCGSGSTEDTNQRLLANLGPSPGGSMVPTTAKPSVTWLAPKSGDTVPRQFTVAVSATEAMGTITQVEIQESGSVLSTLTAPPYQDSFQIPTSIPSGSHLQLTAVAYDSAGQSTSVDTDFIVQTSATQGPIGCLVDADCDLGKTCQAGACGTAPAGGGDMAGTTTSADGGTTMTDPGGVLPGDVAQHQRGGCDAAGGGAPTGALALAVLLGLALLRRRARA